MKRGGEWYLIDTSVIHRQAVPAVSDRVATLGTERPLYRCAVIDLEILSSATSAANYEDRRAMVVAGYAGLTITPAVMTQALKSQRLFAATGRHRAATLGDFIIAACAQVHDAVVVHYDNDFDVIADVTGQPVESVVPAGSFA